MKKFKLRALAKMAWHEMKANYLAWASITILATLIHYLVFTRSIIVVLSLFQLEQTMIGFMITGVLFPLISENTMLFLANKYFLTLNRNPKAVKKHFIDSLKYSLTDGTKKRLHYLLLLLGTMVISFVVLASIYVIPMYLIGGLNAVLFYIGPYIPLLTPLLSFTVIAMVVTISFYLINAHFFLVPYIVQDTLSVDNELAPLSFKRTITKSIQLMRGQKWTYFKLLLSTLIVTAGFIYITARIQSAIYLSTNSMLLQQVCYLLFTLIRVATIDTFSIAIRTVWADSLIGDDPEIVDYEGAEADENIEPVTGSTVLINEEVTPSVPLTTNEQVA